jgi:hypothetical protein
MKTLTRRRWFRRFLWSVLPLAVLVVVVAVAGAPSRQVTPARDTTYFTAPILPDGRIDYVTAVHEVLSEGISNDTNFVGPFLQVYGKGKRLGDGQDALYAQLGIAVPGIDEKTWLHRLDELSDSAFAVGGPLDTAATRPWTQEEFPLLAQALDETQADLDTLLAGLERPQAYQPPLFDGRRQMTNNLCPVAGSSNLAAMQLAIVAMRHLAAKQFDDAWECSLAGQKLSRHVGRLGAMIEYVRAGSVDDRSAEAMRAFLEHSPNGLAERCLRDFLQLQPFPQAAPALDLVERCNLLEVLQYIRYGDSPIEEADSIGWWAWVVNSRVDWDGALRRFNALCDEGVAALNESDFAESLLRIDSLIDQFGSYPDLTERGQIPLTMSQEDLQNRAVAMGLLGFPALHRPRTIQAVGEQRADCIAVGLAVKAFCHESGHPPERLEDLVPRFLTAVPRDRFTGESLTFERTEHHIVVRSVGPDGLDDEGAPYDPEATTGDIAFSCRIDGAP